jgi:hypothetical protein
MKVFLHPHFSRRQALSTLSIAAAAFQFGCSSSFDDLALRPEATKQEGACERARPLDPPGVATDQTRDVELVVAIKAYDMGEVDQLDKTERYLEMGYDLDKTCTGQGEGPSCTNDQWILEPLIWDGPNGRDNAQGAIQYRNYQRRGSASPTESVNSGIATGSITTILRVRGFNEQRLDSKVEVAVFGATMNPQNEAGELLRPLSVPVWRGEDVWSAAYPWWVDNDENAQPSTEHPKYFDADAYVTDWTLVANLDRYEVPTFVQMSQVVITGKLVQNEDGGWALTEGVFAGRLKTDDLLAGLEYIRDPASLEYVCTDSDNYPLYKEMTCGAADVMFEQFSDPTAPCDASSWGWTFEAQPAKLSGTGTAKLPPNCEPDVSPNADSCAILD